MDTKTCVRAIADAYARGDMETVMARVSEDVCFRQHAGSERARYRADCRGREALGAALANIASDFEMLDYRIEDLVVSGNRAASQNTLVLRRRSDGLEVCERDALFWTVEDGHATEIVEYYDTLGVTELTRGNGA